MTFNWNKIYNNGREIELNVNINNVELSVLYPTNSEINTLTDQEVINGLQELLNNSRTIYFSTKLINNLLGINMYDKTID